MSIKDEGTNKTNQSLIVIILITVIEILIKAMNTKYIDQQNAQDTKRQTGNSAEPRGQDIMNADAEGAGSEAAEFAEGGGTSTAAEPGNASESADDETTIGIP
jgi:hypothetical protein